MRLLLSLMINVSGVHQLALKTNERSISIAAVSSAAVAANIDSAWEQDTLLCAYCACDRGALS